MKRLAIVDRQDGAGCFINERMESVICALCVSVMYVGGFIRSEVGGWFAHWPWERKR